MFSFTEAEAATIRAAYKRDGELPARWSCAGCSRALAPKRRGNAQDGSRGGSHC